jgi:hypothetical protein
MPPQKASPPRHLTDLHVYMERLVLLDSLYHSLFAEFADHEVECVHFGWKCFSRSGLGSFRSPGGAERPSHIW